MTKLQVDTIQDSDATGAVDIKHGYTVNNASAEGLTQGIHTGSTPPSSPSNGDLWKSDFYLYIYMESDWYKIVQGSSVSTYTVPFAWGGNKGYYLKDADFANTFNLATGGDATSVSITRSVGQTYGAAGGNATKIVFAGGATHDDCVIITSATAAVSTVSGALSSHTWRRYHTACSNGTTLHLFGGQNAENPDDSTEYLTIDSFSTSTIGGNLTGKVTYPSSVADATYGVRMGGAASGAIGQNTIDYITMGTTGAATDFGDLTAARRTAGSADDTTRGLIAGGIAASTNDDGIDYITTATPSNATDFGNLSAGRYACDGCSNGTRAVFVSGYQASGTNDTMDFVVIQTLGNATDLGDLSSASEQYGTAGAGTHHE